MLKLITIKCTFSAMWGVAERAANVQTVWGFRVIALNPPFLSKS